VNIQQYLQHVADGDSGGSGGGGHTGESGRITRDGLLLRRQNGSIFPWRSCSDFSLFQRFNLGQDIDPVIRDRVSAGALMGRVFFMFDGNGIGKASGLGAFWPDHYTDEAAHKFLDHCATFGYRVSPVCLADARDRSWEWMQSHLYRLGAIFALHWNAGLAQLANEPGKNLPGGVEDARRLGLPSDSRVLWTSGDYDIEQYATTHPVRDYYVGHGERKPEWPRTCRALGEWRDGFGWGQDEHGEERPPFEGVHVPCVDDEPMGCAEVERPGSRVAGPPSDFRQAGAGFQMFGAGGTYHSDNGVISTVWGPIQRQCADEFFYGMAWMPPETQLAAYQRGSAGNGPGIGDMPLVHHDLEEGIDPAALRTFCKRATGFEWCNRIRPRGQSQTRRGCTIESEPRDGLVKVREP
jgi:hypothetical protein